MLCFKRSYEAVAVAVSLLAGIVLAVLEYLSLLVAGITIPLIGAGFGALCLLVDAAASSSLLRQNATFDRCLRIKGPRLAVSAVALILVSALTLILLNPVLPVTLILRFILFTLMTYAAFALACLLICLVVPEGARRS